MKRKEEYAGIDYFRVIAALLVITIHTSPLSSVNQTADFIITRVIARVAVPFFFMASGFFLLPEYMNKKRTNQGKLHPFLKKAAIIYGITSLLYLPINIYAGYFKTQHLLPNILKDIVFDGTFYHLWYLPAAMLGAFITCFLLRRLKTNQVFVITLILYIIGLFGDSYYGIAIKVPLLKSFYNAVFVVSDYTRNGLFFAPVFLILGGLIAKQRGHYKTKACVTGFVISFILMLIEGLTLHAFQVQRHDSMYFMLLPCMVFLFQSLTLWKGRSGQMLRDLSMIIYLVHPLIIVLIRGFAKIANLQRLLIDNSMVHFLAATTCSFAAAGVIALALRIKNKKKITLKQVPIDRAWTEINLVNLHHNVEVLSRILPNGCELMAVVKANAYGHGDVEIARYLNQMGVVSFAVATINEGIRLRKHEIKGDILILGYTDPQRVSELVRYHLSQTVADYKHAKQLDAFGQQIQVHIKIDTGMHRLGESCDNIAEVENIIKCHNLKVCGIFTHLCAADSTLADDVTFTKEQLHRFYNLLEQLKQHHIPLPKTHIQSSYGVLNYPELQCDYARIGIALYGVLSSPNDKTKMQPDLRPVLSLKSRIVLIRSITAGESVSYGRTFTAPRNTIVAVLPIGYADGVPRSLSSGKSAVLIHGCRAPIIGRICMDQLMVDITDIPDVKRGDIATFIGQDGFEEITAEEVAATAETITNELLSRLGDRLERIFL